MRRGHTCPRELCLRLWTLAFGRSAWASSLEPVSKHRAAESSLLSWRFLLQGAAERQERGRASGVKGEGRE